MMFRAELLEKVLAGEKTVTRRPLSDNPRSPWWREKCRYKVGRDYAIVPGRGIAQVGRYEVVSVTKERLREITTADARLEGFRSKLAFCNYWTTMYGAWRGGDEVWRIEFRLKAA